MLIHSPNKSDCPVKGHMNFHWKRHFFSRTRKNDHYKIFRENAEPSFLITKKNCKTSAPRYAFSAHGAFPRIPKTKSLLVTFVIRTNEIFQPASMSSEHLSERKAKAMAEPRSREGKLTPYNRGSHDFTAATRVSASCNQSRTAVSRNVISPWGSEISRQSGSRVCVTLVSHAVLT